MSKDTVEIQGHVFDLEEVNRQAAHVLLDAIFEKQDEGETCNMATTEKIVLTEEENMKRITYRIKVNIEVEDYGN